MMKILMLVQSTWLRRGNHPIPGRKERTMHLSRGRPLVLPPTPVKRQGMNVASLNTKRKIALFTKQAKEGKGWSSTSKGAKYTNFRFLCYPCFLSYLCSFKKSYKFFFKTSKFIIHPNTLSLTDIP